MIQITFQFADIAAAAALLGQLNGNQLGAISAGPVEVAAAPAGKPSAAPTARSPRTAEAAPSTPAPSAAAPAPSTEPPAPPSATEPPAAAPSAPDTVTTTFEYATLQKAVVAAVPKHGKAKLVEIAAKHGAADFKSLPADKWQAAYDDVIALG